MKRAETLKEIRDAMLLEPLSGEGLKSFYVPADHARAPMLPPAQELFDYIREAPKPARVLFASHSGAGKSTELNRLMEEEATEFWFARLETQSVLDLLTLTHIDLLLGIAETLYTRGRAEKLIDDKSLIEPVRRWLSEIVIESNIARREELEIEAGGGLDGPLAQVVGLFARLRSAFSFSAETARVARQKIEPKISELVSYCNKIIAALNKKLANRKPAKQVLVIVEDTDKLDVTRARAVFADYTSLLAELQANIIYTVPIHLIHSNHRVRLETFFTLRTLPMIKIYQQDGAPFAPGWNLLRDIVARRLNPTLIEPEALTLAIEKTGGVVRDLLRAIESASTVARYQNAAQITLPAMEYSLAQLKGAYRNSVRGDADFKVTTEQLYTKMQEIAQSRGGRVPPDDVLQLLLYTKAVIEYNGEGWYDLHPLMRDTLREMGVFDR